MQSVVRQSVPGWNRGRLLSLLPVSILGALLLAAPVMANDAMPRPWDAGDCQLEWCEPVAPPATDADAALQQAADVARLSDGHDCVPADEARPGEIPATMVLRSASGTAERVQWTYPAPEGSWVFALCYAA